MGLPSILRMERRRAHSPPLGSFAYISLMSKLLTDTGREYSTSVFSHMALPVTNVAWMGSGYL